jgi:hypothetical protein
MSDGWKEQIESVLARGSPEALLRMARCQTGRALRYLTGRLCSADEKEKWRAVWGIGVLVGESQLVSQEQATDLLRRFFWTLNDESGAVPWGAPEALGEILAVRPELRGAFLPMLCSLVTDADMRQTGPIERGVVWALGRVGPAVARCSPEAVEALRAATEMHPDRETREVAGRSLASVLEPESNRYA